MTASNLVERHELAAGKLAALMARSASRDLFDTRELLRRPELDPILLRVAFVAYGGMNREDWREVTTVFHEGVPGHHLQVAQTAYRSELLNRWQRLMCWVSGHGEGWALYAERLMEELGYLDDEEFARQRAREKARKYGPRRVSADLLQSGVAREVAEGAVAEEFEGRSELEDARSAARRRYNGAGSEAEARRVYGFLARRGYSAGVCAEVAREHRGPAQS